MMRAHELCRRRRQRPDRAGGSHLSSRMMDMMSVAAADGSRKGAPAGSVGVLVFGSDVMVRGFDDVVVERVRGEGG